MNNIIMFKEKIVSTLKVGDCLYSLHTDSFNFVKKIEWDSELYINVVILDNDERYDYNNDTVGEYSLYFIPKFVITQIEHDYPEYFIWLLYID